MITVRLIRLIRLILAVGSILAFIVIGHISTWNKPYFAMVTYIPWYGWLLLFVGLALYIYESWSTKKRRSR